MFKVGDKVRALKDLKSHNIRAGSIYTITSINGDYIRVDGNASGHANSYELVDENSVEQTSTTEPDYLEITKSICAN